MIILFSVLVLSELKFRQKFNRVSNLDEKKKNLFIFAANSILIRLFFIFLPIKTFFPAGTELHFLIQLIILDLLIYWQHRVMHMNDFLWRFHRTHHLMKSFDVTGGLRFHPLEILISTILKYSLGYILGIGIEVIAIYDAILVSFSLLNHSNISFPRRFEFLVSRVFVLNNIHYIHHMPGYLNSNFGTIIRLWDFIFKTNYEVDANDHSIGIKDQNDKNFLGLLKDPLE